MRTLGLTSLQGSYNASTTPVDVLMAAAFPVSWVEATASSGAVTVGQTIARDDGGNGAVGDGVSQDLAIMNDAGARVIASRLSAEWSDATSGSEDAEVVFSLRVAGLFVEGLRFKGLGVDTQLVSPFAFVLSPNADDTSGLRISTVANDVYIIPQVPADEFYLGNTVADPSVDLNRGTSRAISVIPLGTTLTSLGGGSGNWVNFGSNVVLDYPSASVSGLIAFSGEMRFRQAGGAIGAGNLFKMQGVFTNEIGSSVSIGSQYTFVHVGTYRADGTGGAFAQANLFHRLSLYQPRWETVAGATMAVTTLNAGGLINPTVAAGVTVTNMRDWEWGTLAQAGTILTRDAIYLPNFVGGSTASSGVRSLLTAVATRRFINHTGTAQSDFGGAIGLGAGATIDVLLSRGAANRLDLATGDSFRIINGALEHLAGTIGFNGATPVAQDTGWAVSNVTTDRVLDANATTLDELADVVGTLITYLLSRGDLGA